MTIKTVLRMGEKSLTVPSLPVSDFNSLALLGLIQDLEDTMLHMHGAGIAAPQIGVNLQVVIFGQKTAQSEPNPRYPDADAVPYTVLINPILTFLNEEKEDGWEGCLSVPGLRGVVPRYIKLRYTGFDQFGHDIDRTVTGFHARVVQHECDHLIGVLYPMRIENLNNFGFTDVIFPNQDIQDD